MLLRVLLAGVILTVTSAHSVDTSSFPEQSLQSSKVTRTQVTRNETLISSTCVKREILLDEIERVIDELVAFGITDDHATDFMDWIVNDVIVRRKIIGNETESEEECFPLNRIDEMGTRLGKIIAQDIAGERPGKRGRAIEDIDSDEAEEFSIRQAVSPARKSNPFRFNKSTKNQPKSLAIQKCCKCPKNHYVYENRKNKSKCAKGPCCPKLCRTLERLAGALSSARFPCCRRAHRQCVDNDKKVFMKAAWNQKKRFRFDINTMKINKVKK